MSNFVLGNIYLLLSMIGGAGSQLIIKALVNEYPGSLLSLSDLKDFMNVPHFVTTLIGGFMLIAAFICWLLALTKLELSYAYPIACSSVIFVALFSALFLGEAVTPRMYLGTAFIVIGIILLMPVSSSAAQAWLKG